MEKIVLRYPRYFYIIAAITSIATLCGILYCAVEDGSNPICWLFGIIIYGLFSLYFVITFSQKILFSQESIIVSHLLGVKTLLITDILDCAIIRGYYEGGHTGHWPYIFLSFNLADGSIYKTFMIQGQRIPLEVMEKFYTFKIHIEPYRPFLSLKKSWGLRFMEVFNANRHTKE